MTMNEWEYRVIDDEKWDALTSAESRFNDEVIRYQSSNNDTRYCEDFVLDQLGDNGWELCGIDEPIGIANPEVVCMAPDNGQWTRAWLFKRRKGTRQKWAYTWATSSYFESKAGIKNHTWWSSKDADSIRKALNAYGIDGWELCAARVNGAIINFEPHKSKDRATVLVYYFKRLKN